MLACGIAFAAGLFFGLLVAGVVLVARREDGQQLADENADLARRLGKTLAERDGWRDRYEWVMFGPDDETVRLDRADGEE